VDEVPLADIAVALQSSQVLGEVDVVLELLLFLQVKDLIQALPAPLDVVAGNTPVLREAAFDGDRAEVFGLDIASNTQLLQAMSDGRE